MELVIEKKLDMRELQTLIDSLLSCPSKHSGKRYSGGVLRCCMLVSLWSRYFEMNQGSKYKMEDLDAELNRYITMIMASKVSVVIDYKGIFLFEKNPYIFIPHKLLDSFEAETCKRITRDSKSHFDYIDKRITIPRMSKTKYEVFIGMDQRKRMIEWMLTHFVVSKYVYLCYKETDRSDPIKYHGDMYYQMQRLNEYVKRLGKNHYLLGDVFCRVSMIPYEEMYQYGNELYALRFGNDMLEDRKWE